MTTILGQVAELAANDKVPGEYLKSVDETGAGVGTRYLWIEALKGAGTGDLVEDSEVREVFSDTDALAAYGATSEGYRMCLRALQYGVPIKASAHSISGGVQATAVITVDGSWSATGSWYGRLGGRPIGPIGIGASDSPEDVADEIADWINADPAFAASAAVSAGDDTEFLVTLTAGSPGVRGNSLVLWQDTKELPSGMTVEIGGDVGGTVASDVGPWALDNADNLVIAFNTGGDQTFAVACTPAIITGSGATYNAVTAGHKVTIEILGTQYQAVFAGTENSQALFHAVLAATLAGVALVTNASGQTRITTSRKGSSVTASVVSGDSSVLTSLGLSVGSFTNAGPNNVALNSEVTAAEWVTIMAAITNGTAEDDDGALRLTSATLGGTGSVQVKSASTSDDEMGFDNSVHTGTTGGATLSSGGVYFTGGSGTENIASLLTETFAEEFYTVSSSVRDATNLARLETQIDTKLGPLEGRLECAVGGLVGTMSASGSITQSTLNDSSFCMPWMEEGETPAEEIGAGIAAYRHLLESASNAMDPNQRYDDVLLEWIQPQEAPGKRPSRATLVAALNLGLTPLATRNGKVYMVRAVTTRTLTDEGEADDGTIDVGTDRTSKRYREELKATLRQHRADHRYLDNDPAEGEEPNVRKDTTYPKRAADAIKSLNVRLRDRGWITQIDLAANQPRCALNPDSSTPRLVVYAPHVPTPLFHQAEGIVAKRKFLVAVTA